jgi:hypothetical protein
MPREEVAASVSEASIVAVGTDVACIDTTGSDSVKSPHIIVPLCGGHVRNFLPLGEQTTT